MKKASKLPIKTVYYTDESNDEFSDADIKAKKIDESYTYVQRSFFWRIKRFIAYRTLIVPIAFIYTKLGLGQRIKNRRALKGYRKSGFFLFINHTQQIGDAFMPNVVFFPKNVYIIVHPDNVSMPGLGRLTPYLGAIPTPNTFSAMKNFRSTVEKRITDGNCVAVYPEAHIWPYYTGIRNFSSTSFRFPVELNVPSFTMTNTYQKRRFSKKPRITSYIDGPFLPDTSLDKRSSINDLRDRVYEKMKERSLLSSCEYIRYLPIEKKREACEEENRKDLRL